MFRFKQFDIEQEGAPFKVGTDSLILGAWTEVQGGETVLDIGTGTGVLALMIAQKLENGRVLAIEPERSAFEIAEKNILNSTFRDKMVIVNEPLQRVQPNEKIDLIITNPPYFIDSTKSATPSSMRARHTEELNFKEIIEFSVKFLSSDGKLSIILPTAEANKFEIEAHAKGLFKVKELLISSFENTETKRKCLEFGRHKTSLTSEQLAIRNKLEHSYTAAYKTLTANYHHHF